jgi:hypothetical protein
MQAVMAAAAAAAAGAGGGGSGHGAAAGTTSMTVAELKKAITGLGGKPAGKKADLINQLQAVRAASAAASPAASTGAKRATASGDADASSSDNDSDGDEAKNMERVTAEQTSLIGTQFIDTDDHDAKLQVTDVYHCRFSGCKKLVLCCDIVPIIAAAAVAAGASKRRKAPAERLDYKHATYVAFEADVLPYLGSEHTKGKYEPIEYEPSE